MKPEYEFTFKAYSTITMNGDIVDGIGAYPGQKEELIVKDIYKQYEMFSDLIEKVPDYIKVGSESFESDELEKKYQYTKYTSETAKRIGQWFDIAPAKVDFVNGKLFGGVGVDLFKTLDLVQGEGFKPKAGLSPNQKISSFERLAQTPVLKGFLTTSTYGSFIKNIELADDVKQSLSNPRFIKNQQAEIMYESMKNMAQPEAKAEWIRIRKEEPAMSKLLSDIWEDEKAGMNHMERITKGMGVANGERANYIFKQLELLDDKDAQIELYRRLKSLKLINKEVDQGINLLFERGK